MRVVRVGAGGAIGEAVLCGGHDDLLPGGLDGEGRGDVEVGPVLADAGVGFGVELVEAADEDGGGELEPDVVRIDEEDEVIFPDFLLSATLRQDIHDIEQTLQLGDVAAAKVPVRPVILLLPVQQRGHGIAEGDGGHDGLAQVDAGLVGGHEDAQAAGGGGVVVPLGSVEVVELGPGHLLIFDVVPWDEEIIKVGGELFVC